MEKETFFQTKFSVTVDSVKGDCKAGHKAGDKMEIDCYRAGNLCGFCYHSIFPNLQVLQTGGKMPWFPDGNTVKMGCPDPFNLVTFTLERIKSE